MSWHADADLLERYMSDSLDDARAYSLEAHLLSCAECRTGLADAADLADPVRLDRIWRGVDDVLDIPRPGLVERGLVAIGVREHVARLLAATPSLRLSWFVAEGIALGSAVVAANSAAAQGGRTTVALLVFLFVAGLLPVAGVAVAYGPGVDPTHEIGLASPMRSFQVLLLRTIAVLATTMALTGLAALALPAHDWTAVAWLLPALGLTLACLALSTWVRPLVAAASVTAAWIAIALAATYRWSDGLTVFRGGGQLAFVLIIAVSAWVLTQRRGAFDQGVVT